MEMHRSHSPDGFGSLTTRLIAWILLAAGLVFTATVVLSNMSSRAAAFRMAEREAEQVAASSIHRIEEILHSLEEGARLVSSALQNLDPSELEVERLLEDVVAGSPNLYGAGAFYAAGGPGTGAERFGVYVHRDRENRIVRGDPAVDTYRDWEEAWRTDPASRGTPAWSEPYLDPGRASSHLVTYSVPFRTDHATFRGVVTADVDLEFLSRIVQTIAPRGEHATSSAEEPAGFGLILSRSGRVLAAPDASRIGTDQPLLEQLDPETRNEVAHRVEDMLAGGSGAGALRLGARDYRVQYAPVGRTGWSVAVLTSEEELLSDVRRLRWLQAGLGVAGLALLAAVVVALSWRLTRPLKALAESAERLATGDLDLQLPPVSSRDEIGTLTQAFHHMRGSLKSYIQNLQDTTRAKERLESELRIARRIQMAMLPESTAGSTADRYRLAALLVPARAVGGDLFDHFHREGKTFFLTADVSGKGVPAALFMARAKTLFETIAAREADPGVILRLVNRGLCAENEEGMFVTGICGYLETHAGELTFASAGHDPPVLLPSAGLPRLLETAGGPVLGLMEQAEFPVNGLRLAPQDGVVLYTDGVSEAQNESGEYFGSQRLLASLEGLRSSDPEAMSEGVLGAIREFAGSAPQSDDITVLVLRYRPSAPGVTRSSS